jgi:hypothetical protein
MSCHDHQNLQIKYVCHSGKDDDSMESRSWCLKTAKPQTRFSNTPSSCQRI